MADGESQPSGPGKVDKRAERQALVIFWTMAALAVTAAIGFIAAVVNFILSFR